MVKYSFGDILIIITLMYWITYSIVVVIYLNYLTNKYLVPKSRDSIIKDKKLKTQQEIVEKYKNKNQINLLVLTGGGVRGLVSLRVLAKLEEITGLKAGELFDFVSGTSTGAISVSSLIVGDGKGGYKYSATDIANNYYAHSKSMFSAPWYHQYLTSFGLLAPRFLPDNKLKILDSYFGDLTIGELAGNMLVPVYNIDQNNLQLVKNWVTPYGQQNENYLIKDLINGASNPPMIFTPICFSIKQKNHLLIDPAVILNNPILQVLLYVRGLLPDKHINLVFIGNGGIANEPYDYRSMFGFGLYGLYQYLFSAPNLSSRLYIDFMEDYLRDAKLFDKNISYFAITGMPKSPMSPTSLSKRNFKKIENYAHEVIEKNQSKLQELANILTCERKKQ